MFNKRIARIFLWSLVILMLFSNTCVGKDIDLCDEYAKKSSEGYLNKVSPIKHKFEKLIGESIDRFVKQYGEKYRIIYGRELEDIYKNTVSFLDAEYLVKVTENIRTVRDKNPDLCEDRKVIDDYVKNNFYYYSGKMAEMTDEINMHESDYALDKNQGFVYLGINVEGLLYGLKLTGVESHTLENIEVGENYYFIKLKKGRYRWSKAYPNADTKRVYFSIKDEVEFTVKEGVVNIAGMYFLVENQGEEIVSRMTNRYAGLIDRLESSHPTLMRMFPVKNAYFGDDKFYEFYRKEMVE